MKTQGCDGARPKTTGFKRGMQRRGEGGYLRVTWTLRGFGCTIPPLMGAAFSWERGAKKKEESGGSHSLLVRKAPVRRWERRQSSKIFGGKGGRLGKEEGELGEKLGRCEPKYPTEKQAEDREKEANRRNEGGGGWVVPTIHKKPCGKNSRRVGKFAGRGGGRFGGGGKEWSKGYCVSSLQFAVCYRGQEVRGHRYDRW